MTKQYKNSPIAEVVCEFRFELENAIDQKAVDLFFEEIKDKFPKSKKGQMNKLEVKVDAKENKDEFSKSFYQFDQFFSDDEKTLIQLDKGRLSIHKLKPYDSWKEFYPLIILVFNSYVKSIKIKSIQRIGLRYINNFEIPSLSFDIEQYFNLRPAMLGGLPQDLSSFMVGVIFVFEGGKDDMKVQFLNQTMTNANADKTIFILDMDYFSSNISTDNVEKWITNAHKNIENVFESALADKTKQLFN